MRTKAEALANHIRKLVALRAIERRKDWIK